MHNNSNTSGSDCYLPHAVESSDISRLLLVSLADPDVSYNSDWKLNTQETIRVFFPIPSSHLDAATRNFIFVDSGGFCGTNQYDY